MKCYLLILMVVAGLCSCERDSFEVDESTESNYPKHIIGISAQTEDISSRGTPINNVQGMTNIGVFCAYTGLADWTAGSSIPGKMFDTELVRNSGTGKWTYTDTPVRWDPANGNDRYSFFAYSPRATAQNGITVQSNSSTVGIPTIGYTIPTNVTLQPDLMFAVPRFNIRPATSMVSFDMKHALTCVSFQVQGNGEQIKAVTISGVYSSANAAINGSSISWSGGTVPSTPINYSALINFDAGKTYFTASTTMSTNLMAGNGYLMMIPQTLTPAAKLTLTFADNTTKDISLNGQNWTAGKKVNYNIIITQTGVITISPSEYYIPSLGVTYKTDNFQLSCTPSTAQWTLTSNVPWLRLTTDPSGANAGLTISGLGSKTIYTVADANPGSANRVASLYANGNQSIVAGTITQLKKVDLTTIKNGGRTPAYVTSYVGAFWQAGQTGERIIRIPIGNTNDCIGAWTASVEWMDGNWQPDDIRFSPVLSLDPNVLSPLDATPGDAESYKVTDALTATSGFVPLDGTIYFRIGLKSTFTPTDATPARYAVVTFTYSNGLHTQLILLRQGADADYVMRPIDAATGSYISSTRPMARKIAAFNLTQNEVSNWEGGAAIANHPAPAFQRGVFTDYPSQAGAFFQWASIDQQRRVYHPINPVGAISGWSSYTTPQFWGIGSGAPAFSAFLEVCPPGYKRINDGSEISGANQAASTSELRQSLLNTLANGTTVNGLDNAIYGYYADGFFDRRQIKPGRSGDLSVVSYYPSTPSNPLNAKIAYCGTLIYNPKTWASVFLPLTGFRNSTDGAMSSSEQYSWYWTASATGFVSDALGFYPMKGIRLMYGIEYNRAFGGAIRCVKVQAP